MKDEQEYERVFNQVSQGNSTINFEQFVAYLTEVVADKDTAESIKQAFKTLANGQVLHFSSLSLSLLHLPMIWI